MINILFVMYHDFRTSSAIHVHSLSNSLQELGYECKVAVPSKKEDAEMHLGEGILYEAVNFDETFGHHFCYPDGRGPDIIHAWTPREIVRLQCKKLKQIFPECKIIIHLEDNEEVILEQNMGLGLDFFQDASNDILDEITPPALSHFNYFKEFIAESDGITLIIDTLKDFVPSGKPWMRLWPIIETDTYHSKQPDLSLKNEFGIRNNEFVVAYTGSVHRVNYKEVRSLYLATALANRNGIPVKLIRTGKNEYDFFKGYGEWLKEYSVELGRVDREKIPKILGISDLLVQPGKDDRFNAYRLPSKIPEYLSMEKAVAVPHSNIGKILEDRNQALILQTGDALDILNAIKEIKTNEELKKKIALGGRQFALLHFNKKKITTQLLDFYHSIMNINPEKVF